MGAAFAKALEIAERLGDAEGQLRALSGLNFYHTGSGRYRAALPFAQRFHDLATRESDLYDRLFGERMMGVAKHFLGDQIGARRHLTRALTHYPAIDPRRDIIRFQTDLCVSARAYLARVLMAARVFRAGGARCRDEHSGGARDRSRSLALFGPRFGGMSDRPVDR